MKTSIHQIQDINKRYYTDNEKEYDFLAQKLSKEKIDSKAIIKKIQEFQVAIPSWALGAGGTRFGRFNLKGEPENLEQKLQDIGILNALTKNAGAISLHIPWDNIQTKDYGAIKQLAQQEGITFDAINSNTFQDQPNTQYSYKYGSLNNVNKQVRDQAIEHNINVINIGEKLGSKSITVWLADGTNFPGQSNFQSALEYTQNSLQEIYKHLPDNWKMFIEYKPYEPNFYSTTIQDWGTSFILANACGSKAFTLVDLGHHLPNTNIEQIVATLLYKGKLGGFHFNDSKYGDDDLTVGSIKPYNLFLIFCELVYGMEKNTNNPPISWMIDASHNVKDPLEDLLQSLDAILIAYTQALIVNREKLSEAQQNVDVTLCQEILQDAFRTDIRPIIKKARYEINAAVQPIKTYREMRIREKLAKQRNINSKASGL